MPHLNLSTTKKRASLTRFFVTCYLQPSLSRTDSIDDCFAQGPKMINKMRADVLAVEQP